MLLIHCCVSWTGISWMVAVPDVSRLSFDELWNSELPFAMRSAEISEPFEFSAFRLAFSLLFWLFWLLFVDACLVFRVDGFRWIRRCRAAKRCVSLVDHQSLVIVQEWSNASSRMSNTSATYTAYPFGRILSSRSRKRTDVLHCGSSCGVEGGSSARIDDRIRCKGKASRPYAYACGRPACTCRRTTIRRHCTATTSNRVRP